MIRLIEMTLAFCIAMLFSLENSAVAEEPGTARPKNAFQTIVFDGSPRGSGWGLGLLQESPLKPGILLSGAYDVIHQYDLTEHAVTLGGMFTPPGDRYAFSADLSWASLGLLAPSLQAGIEVSLMKLHQVIIPVFGLRYRTYSDSTLATLQVGSDIYASTLPLFWILRTYSSLYSSRYHDIRARLVFASSLKMGIELPSDFLISFKGAAGNEGSLAEVANAGSEIRTYGFYLVGLGLKLPAVFNKQLRIESTFEWQRYPALKLGIIRISLGGTWAW